MWVLKYTTKEVLHVIDAKTQLRKKNAVILE